ncbi:MAG: hypothetical protein Q8N03_17930 [Ignavibacteria bacterium]|jgi:hypothetical protein|nr:hypothetical protein [Ignavibacteria bacterium]
MNRIFERNTFNALLFLFIFFLSLLRGEYLFALIAIVFAMIFIWMDMIWGEKIKLNRISLEESVYEYD